MNLNIEQKLTELVNDTMFHPPALCFEDILASVSMLNYGPVSLGEVYKRGFFNANHKQLWLNAGAIRVRVLSDSWWDRNSQLTTSEPSLRKNHEKKKVFGLPGYTYIYIYLEPK